MKIEGNVFIVTGGASGLGEGTALLLAARGAKGRSGLCSSVVTLPGS